MDIRSWNLANPSPTEDYKYIGPSFLSTYSMTVRGQLPTITYLLICFIISTPFNYTTFQLLYNEDGIPAGADSASHTFFILGILDTNEPLIRYTAFPTILTNTSGYYPSFMHLTIATLVKAFAFDQDSYDPTLVIEVERSFMLATSLIGTAGYALLVRAILGRLLDAKINSHLHSLDKPKYSIIYLIISVVAFGIFINSVSPIVQTFNDGSYPSSSLCGQSSLFTCST